MNDEHKDVLNDIKELFQRCESYEKALIKIADECWVSAGTDRKLYKGWRKLATARVDIARKVLKKYGVSL